MRMLSVFLGLCPLLILPIATRAQAMTVGQFHKVIVGPYIQATFVQGDRENVTINGTVVDSSKLNIEVKNGTLRLYLEGAKDFPHDQRVYDSEGRMQNQHLYRDHSMVVTVSYRRLDAVSLRGTETYLFSSPVSANKFALHLYGESSVIFTEAHVSKMHTTIYGSGSLDIRSGEVDEQFYTCYGEGKVNAAAIIGQAAKVTAFGEAEFNVNVSEEIRVTAFGEAKIRYVGNPTIVKGLHFGGVDLQKLY